MIIADLLSSINDLCRDKDISDDAVRFEIGLEISSALTKAGIYGCLVDIPLSGQKVKIMPQSIYAAVILDGHVYNEANLINNTFYDVEDYIYLIGLDGKVLKCEKNKSVTTLFINSD